jgi:hypothetical protein
MKIKIHADLEVGFNEVKPGEVFQWQRQTYCKASGKEVDRGCRWNALNLETGAICSFDDITDVVPFQATLSLKPRKQ